MAQRTTIRPVQVITDAVMTATLHSTVTILESITGVSYTAYWTGTSPVGTLSVEGCNDAQVYPTGGIVPNTGHWVALALIDDTGTVVTSIPVSGNTGQKFVNVPGFEGGFIRLTYTYSSGTGTLNAFLVGKVS